MKLYKHQVNELEAIKDRNRCALYWEMGTGKTFGGSAKMMQLGAKVNLVICQKSKVDDWVNHFNDNYRRKDEPYSLNVWDLTHIGGIKGFLSGVSQIENGQYTVIGVINYEMAFRRPELLKLKDFTLMLDESSMIQNESAKRTKFILKMKPKNVILLSGTPVNGKYEKLWSQLKLLGWGISKKLFLDTYCIREYKYDRWGNKICGKSGFPVKFVTGYKNVERLKRKLAEHGARFLKTEDVFDLPEQTFNVIKIPTTAAYRKFRKPAHKGGCIVTVDDLTFVGETTLTKMLYERMLCGSYNKEKLNAFRDILESTSDRVIVFYNFNDELEKLTEIALDYTEHISVVNGKQRDLEAYENHDDTITFIQYQAGAMGLNLQKANKIVYFTPTLSSELFEQSKKRTHRLGQSKPCSYYQLVCKGSIEEKIYNVLAMRRDYTESLFKGDSYEN